jgi:hypothetical protein
MHAIAQQTPFPIAAGNPFNLDDDAAYRRWRESKLRDYPDRVEELMVEVGDPRSLTAAEREAIMRRCEKTNMAIYASPVRNADKQIPRLLGRQFGLERIDGNWLADDDGITQVTVAASGQRGDFIPYTNRPIKWHTDGYYNAPGCAIRAMLLHCVTEAESGGENGLLDHEIAYLMMRDADPGMVMALMAEDAMTIPARVAEDGVARPAQSGPVFKVDPADGALHMRYTARTRSIEWKQDAATSAAVAFLEKLFSSASRYIFHARLTSGGGLISNNVLHDRSGFDDGSHGKRLLYRARYYDRLKRL